MESSIFATTALVATAGIASADIALTGMAQMGLQGGSNINGTTATTQFVQDIDVTFTMTGETDHGLSFGAAIDLDESAAGVGADDAGVAIFVRGAFGTLTMGDTDGALDWAMQETDFRGAASINDNHTTHAGFNGNGGLDAVYDNQIVRYDYTIGAFGVALSIEMDDDATARGGFAGANVLAAANAPLVGADPIWGIGLRYGGDFAAGTYSLGLGYQTSSDIDDSVAGDQEVSITGLSGAVALSSGLALSANYSQIDSFVANGDGVHMGIGASYAIDAITLHANYGEFDWDPGAFARDSSGYGLSAAYSFGGGLSAHIGYGASDFSAANASGAALGDSSTWTFGLNMAF